MRFKPRNTIVAHLDVGELLPLKVVHSGLKRVQLSDKNTRIPGEQWPKLFRLDTHVDKEVDSRRHITFEVKANSKAGSPGFTEKDTNSFWLFMTEPWKKVKFVHFPIKFAPVFFKAWSCCEEISAIYRHRFERCKKCTYEIVSILTVQPPSPHLQYHWIGFTAGRGEGSSVLTNFKRQRYPCLSIGSVSYLSSHCERSTPRSTSFWSVGCSLTTEARE